MAHLTTTRSRLAINNWKHIACGTRLATNNTERPTHVPHYAYDGFKCVLRIRCVAHLHIIGSSRATSQSTWRSGCSHVAKRDGCQVVAVERAEFFPWSGTWMLRCCRGASLVGCHVVAARRHVNLVNACSVGSGGATKC